MLQILGAGWHRALAPLLWLLDRPSRSPTRLLIAPQDIHTADPTVASDIYAGYFSFGGKIINAHGQSPFDIEPPSVGWDETLHGFGWLRHMRAADTSLARANARALVEDWMSHGQRGRLAWEPRVVARRLLSWLSQSPVILDGADGPFYRRLMKSLGRQTAFLQRRMNNGLVGESRLWAALSLAEMGICADGLPTLQRLGSRMLLEELGRQILTDGGHVSRNPQVLGDLLLDLLPLRQAYAARGAEVPVALLNAIDRMMPMLRMFRHPDGSLALFNGMGVTRPETLATVLAYDDAHAMPLGNAPYSGYQRVEAGEAVLICDMGRPPPPIFSKRSHAGTLSFELSVGGQRLVVNCGSPDPDRRDLSQAARVTAAHSTLTLADMSSSRFAGSHGWVRALDGMVFAPPQAVTVARSDVAEGVWLDALHDGYARLGFAHRRQMWLSHAGTRLSGEDHLVPLAGRPDAAALPFAVRFHLHPLVRAAFAADGTTITIGMPNGDEWLFEAGGLAIEIEESIFFASAEGPRRTEQLVVQGETATLRQVAWSFTQRLETPPPEL